MTARLALMIVAAVVDVLLKNLVAHYCKNLVDSRYRFMGFHDFYQLNEPVWYSPNGNRTSILSPR